METIKKEGEICFKCRNRMERRIRVSFNESEWTKPYIFSEWDYCKACTRTQHYEKYKIDLTKYNEETKKRYDAIKQRKQDQEQAKTLQRELDEGFRRHLDKD